VVKIKTLIKDGMVVDPANNLRKITNILINGNIVEKIHPEITPREAEVVINAEDKLVVPGLIDLHVHLRDPGQTHKEDLATGTMAAAHGGFTSVACMPNTTPVLDTPERVKTLVQRLKKEAHVNVFPVAAVTKGLEGEVVTDFEGLKAAGAVAFSDDGKVVQHASIMYEALKRAGALSLPICQHAEDASLSCGTVINEGEVAEKLGVKGDPDISESVIIARDIVLAAHTGGHVHVGHISTELGVTLVRRAKQMGIKVTAEVTPHHLLLTDEYVLKAGPNAKMRPPLRTQQDVEAIRQALADGIIDCIVTDHAPHAAEEKNVDLADAANGIVGLETALGLVLTHLVGEKVLSLEDAIAAMTYKPASILGLDKGVLAAGKDADITIIDLNKKWTVDPEAFFSKSRNTPFSGWQLTGKPVLTMVGGKVVWSDESINIEVVNSDKVS